MNLDAIDACIAKSVSWFRKQQKSDGSWAGALRSNIAIWYGAGLALDGESADSEVVQDICNYLISCYDGNLGFGPYPGEPATASDTMSVISFLRWARPSAPELGHSETSFAKSFTPIRDPSAQFLRFVFEAHSRAEILRDEGPPNWVRLLSHRILSKHPSEMWDLSRVYPRVYQKPSVFQRHIVPHLLRARCFLPENDLQLAADRTPQKTAFDLFLMISAGFGRLREDDSPSGKRLYDFAKQWRPKIIFADGSYEWITANVADLFFCSAAGMTNEAQQAASTLRKMEYLGDGWIQGNEVSLNIFDTGLSVMALAAAGLMKEDDAISRASQFLRQARSPRNGLWSWSYFEGMGDERRYLDTDDSGVACMALCAAGEISGSSLLSLAAQNLKLMQERSGAFSTFGDNGALKPNFCWLSNSGRALQALVLSGVPVESGEVQNGITWILKSQLSDGSWVDGWCARYIYGTAIALETLIKICAADVDRQCVRKAVDWLLSMQNQDGGWGENWCGGRSASTPEQTGVALYAICLAAKFVDVPSKSVLTAIDWLVENQTEEGSWTASYFVSFGFNVGFADSHLAPVWALHGLGAARNYLRHKNT